MEAGTDNLAPTHAQMGIALPHSQHVESRTVVLPDLRVLFLPMPKAGCTTVLWLLAEIAGLPPETFSRSTLPEVSPDGRTLLFTAPTDMPLEAEG